MIIGIKMTQKQLTNKELFLSHYCKNKGCDMKDVKQIFGQKEKTCPFCKKKTLK